MVEWVHPITWNWSNFLKYKSISDVEDKKTLTLSDIGKSLSSRARAWCVSASKFSEVWASTTCEQRRVITSQQMNKVDCCCGPIRLWMHIFNIPLHIISFHSWLFITEHLNIAQGRQSNVDGMRIDFALLLGHIIWSFKREKGAGGNWVEVVIQDDPKQLRSLSTSRMR